ncbi:hypothetical protein PTKIN_Ptkin16aG0077200 [Pterospermum kingtungense]
MEGHNMCWSAIVGDNVLKGHENYANWSACIKNYLRSRDLWEVVEETTTSEPPEKEEICNVADLKAWEKRNASALHAIQISCAPTMLAYIRDKTTAKDAWYTLAQKCQRPPKSAQPAVEVVERTEVLALRNAINRSDVTAVKNLLMAKPSLIASKIYGFKDRMTFHLAITDRNLEMIEVLLSCMSADDVKMRDSFGRTALHYAARSPGNTKIAEMLIRKNKDLLTITNEYGFIPLSEACHKGHKDMSYYLYNIMTRPYLLSLGNRTHAAVVVCCCINSKLFDIALDLLHHCPELAVVRYLNQNSNAVLQLSFQPSEFLSSCRLSLCQRKIYSCLKVKQLEALSSDEDDNVCINTHERQNQRKTKNFMTQVEEKLLELWKNLLKHFGIKQIYDLKVNHVYAQELLRLISERILALNAEETSRSLVFDAIINASQRGMTEFIVHIIKTNPDLLNTLDNNGRNIFSVAVLCRQENVFSLIYRLETVKHDFPTYEDKFGDTMLHLAGKLEAASQLKLDQISGAALQMQRELQWFKEVEGIVSPTYKNSRNGDGKTPDEVFDRNHANLLKMGEQWMKDIAQSSTIVGTLIITIMFAALFTAPGGNNQDTGIPLLLNKKLFKVFVISDAISLFASSTSVLTFVGILTSRYSKDDFLVSLPRKLIIGLSALFISIAAMMVAFCSSVIIMVKSQLEIVIPIVLLAGIPVGLFVWLQFPLLVTTIISTYGPGIFDRKMKKWL